MKTRKNNDGTVTIRMGYNKLCALTIGLRESMRNNQERAEQSTNDYVKGLYYEFMDEDLERLRKASKLFDWAIAIQEEKNK